MCAQKGDIQLKSLKLDVLNIPLATKKRKAYMMVAVSTCVITVLSVLSTFNFVSINAFAAVDENPITMYASTPEGFSNGDPNTKKTIFASVHRADLGESGFQWQATGQIKNTSDKRLQR